jgi:hypothetical protein
LDFFTGFSVESDSGSDFTLSELLFKEFSSLERFKLVSFSRRSAKTFSLNFALRMASAESGFSEAVVVFLVGSVVFTAKKSSSPDNRRIFGFLEVSFLASSTRGSRFLRLKELNGFVEDGVP